MLARLVRDPEQFKDENKRFTGLHSVRLAASRTNPALLEEAGRSRERGWLRSRLCSSGEKPVNVASPRLG